LAEEVLHPDTPKVDLILMDIMMPGIDGLEACRSIKADPRMADVPVIMVTAVTDADSLRRAFAAGAIDYIRKPILGVELVARVCTVLTMTAEMAMRKRREHDLEMAMRELKALRGCAPICASCKRIRGPSGEWKSLEDYVKTHSDLRVDDTICQHCVDQWCKDQEAA
jgi:DNA-binding response OmpR family regulator